MSSHGRVVTARENAENFWRNKPLLWFGKDDNPMILEPVTLILLAIVFLATLTQSTFGFGNALIAMPLLALFLDIHTVRPLVALLAFTISVGIVFWDWRQVQIRGNWYLIGFSLLGVGVGIFFLQKISPEVIVLLLGLVVVGFALFGLCGLGQRQHLSNDRWAGFFGFGAGILGGAYNTYGPLLVLYATLRGWPKEQFRATLQGCFFPTSLLILFLHWKNGRWTPQLGQLYLMCLPLAVGGLFLGKYLNTRLPRDKFIRLVYALLLVLGFSLILKVIFLFFL